MKTLQKLSVVSLFAKRSLRYIGHRGCNTILFGVLSVGLAFPWSSAFAASAKAQAPMPIQYDTTTRPGTATLLAYSDLDLDGGLIHGQPPPPRGIAWPKPPKGCSETGIPGSTIANPLASCPIAPPYIINFPGVFGAGPMYLPCYGHIFEKPPLTTMKNCRVQSRTSKTVGAVINVSHGWANLEHYDNRTKYKLIAYAYNNPAGTGRAAAQSSDPFTVESGDYPYEPRAEAQLEVSEVCEYSEGHSHCIEEYADASFAAELDGVLAWALYIHLNAGESHPNVYFYIDNERFPDVNEQEVESYIYESIEFNTDGITSIATLDAPIFSTMLHLYIPAEYSQTSNAGTDYVEVDTETGGF